MRGKTMHRERHLLLYQFLMVFILTTFILPSKAHAITGSAAPIEITTLVDDSPFDARDPGTSGRIPLILIHGIHGNEWPTGTSYEGTDSISNPYRGYFENLLNHLYETGVAEKYKIYRFHYMSDILPVKDIAQGLQERIDLMIQEGKLEDRQFVILAHSMGGLVGRSYMNEQSHTTGIYNGNKGGERIIKLITLATPHHGSPSANELAREYIATDTWVPGDSWAPLMDIIDLLYWWNYDIDNNWNPDSPNRSDLRWDNYDDRMSGGTCVLNMVPVPCYDNSQEKNTWLQNLNNYTSFDSKTIAYYGYIDPSNDANNTDENRTWLINQINDPLFNKYDTLLQYACGSLNPFNCVGGEHQQLLVVNILMSEGMNNYFLYNDGMVPTDSGRFSGHTLADRRQFIGYDHLDMKDGRVDSLTLFDSVKSDLNEIWSEINPEITSALKIYPEQNSYSVGQTIQSQFGITNKSGASITVANLTVGGRDPDGLVVDFPAKTCVTINPNEQYKYEDSLTLTKAGIYKFFPAYETLTNKLVCPVPDGNWNGRIPTESGITQYTFDSPLNITAVIDTTKPTISITSPSNSSTVSGTTTVAVSTYDANGINKVVYYLDNGLKFSNSTSPYSWSWNTIDTTNGSHTVKAIAYDTAGNSSETSITVTVSNTTGTGNNAPNIPSALSQYKSDGVTGMGAGATTNERTIVMKGTVSDPDNDAVSLEAEIKTVGTAFSNSPSSNCASSGFATSGGTAAVTCSGLADGQYKWQARAKDNNGGYSGWTQAGYSSESSADFIVSAATVVNTPPVVTMITPNGGETWTAWSPYTIKWSAIDDTGTISKVEIYNSTDGGVSWSPSPINSNTTNMGTYSWTPTSTTTQGRIKVVATDSGNAQGIAMSNGNFSVVSSCAKPTAPTLQGISVYGSSYTVSWSASSGATYYNLQQDTSSSFTNPSVVYTSNGTSWYSGDKLSGTYYYRVKAINNCGESEWSSTQSVIIQANQGPGDIAAVNPVDSGTNQPLNLTLSWSAGHSGGESLKFNVYVVHSDTTIFYPNNIQSYEQTGTTFTLSNLPYNTIISWGIEAIDSTGDRKYSPMFHFTTLGDATVPTGSVLINNGASSATSYSVSLNLSAADSNSGVRYMMLSNDGTNWTYWIPYSSQYAWNLADYYYGGQSGLSTYTVYAKFRDYEGNESQVYSDTITKTTGTAGQILLNGKVYQNIQDAIDAATSGETVYLTEGMYQFAGSVIPTNHTDRTGGIQMKPGVTLKGAGAGKTTIDVSGYAFAAIIDADNSVIEGLTIINSNSLSWRYVVLLESDSSKIKNCILKGGASGVYVGWNATYSARNSEISNNTIINNSQSGIWLNSGSNISIFNNTIANNTQYGLFGFLASAKIINNIIANNGAGGYCGISSYEAFSTFQNNDVFNNYANYCGVSAQTGINGNISANSSFVNTSVADYHLSPGSPAIDTGSNVGIAYNGSAPDMGAYEYNGTGTIQVTSNRTDASFTIKGPSGTYSGSGMSWSMAGLPIGIYNATFAPITSRYTPSYQTTMLYSGQTLTFDGTYAADTVGPTGTIAVNFEEYATADNLVSVTLDITDDVAGVGESSQMMFSNDGVTWSPAEPYSAIKKDWDLTLYVGNTTSGTKTVYAKVSDLFGNWSTLSDTIKYVPDRQVLEVPTQYSTIQSAIDAAQDGDMVYVLPGTYTEQITLNGGIRLQGSGAANTILDGNNTNINVNDNTMIDGFTIATNPSSGISSNASSIISNNTILGYAAIGNGNGNGRLIIRNNIIKVSSWGIYLGNNCSSCPPLSVDIENNIITGAAQGIDLVGSQLFKATINIRNNIFYNNGTAINDRHSDTTRKHFFPSFNTYWNNTNNFAGNISAMGAGDINSDPLFVDSANANYQLQTNSPAFNSGNPEGKYNDPDGSRNDRGAYGGPSLNAPPKADFSISSLTAVPGTTFTFDAGLSHDGQSKDEKLKVRWDFDGNGTYDTTFTTDKITTRKYDTTATFNVALQVKDEKGYMSTATKAISVVNQSPNVPANAVPADTSTTGITPILSWSGGDPDYSDTVIYDVYFGTSSNPPLISSGQTEIFFNPGTLEYSKTYYWQLVATDSHGATSIGPLWYFITETPDIIPPTGTIIINDGSGSDYTNSTSISLTLWASDNSGTVSSMRFSDDATTWSDWEAYTTSKAWTLASGDGTKTVYAQFKDAVGNVSGSYSDTIIFDTTSPEFTSTAPSADSIINTASVGYTLGETAFSGKVTFIQTGGTADPSSPQIYNLAAPDMTAGTHTVNTGLPLVNGAIYTVTFEATDLAGNVATPISGANVTFDTTTASVTINTPASGSVTNNVSVGYTLSEAISSGNIVFTSTGGNTDGGSPHTYTLAGAELAAGAHSISTGIILVDGAIYTVSIENVFDMAGNATAAVSNTSITYDSTSVAITNTTPAANSAIATATVSYTLSEQAQGGTVTFTQTGGNADAGSPRIYTMNGADLLSGDHTVDTGLGLVDGAVYTVSFNATDMAGNAATTVSNAIVLFDNIHDITVTITGSGTVIPSGATGVSHGDTRTFTATPDPGYHIDTVTGCGGNLTGNIFTTGAITADCALTASFDIDTFTVTTSAGANGVIDATAIVNYGGNLTVNITPNAGYHVADVLVNGSSVGAVTGYTFTSVTAGHTISASFAINTFAVTFVSGGNGTLTGTASQTINYGGSATAVTAVPATGYHFVNWTGDGGFVTTTSNSLTVTNVTAAQTITANFAIDTFAVTPTAGSGGTITPSTPQTLNYGSTTAFTVTPNTGYHINTVTGCNGTLSGSAYTTGAITADCSVAATFASDDTTPPVFTSTVPASNSYINTVTVGYTLSEAVASGKITFARTGGSADSASHIYIFTDSDKTVGTHSVNTGLSLINVGIYTVTFEATDLAGNAATVVSNTGVVYDNTSASVVINSPSSNSRTNSISVSYTLNEEITSGDIVFTRTGGTTDGLSPRKHTLGASEKSSGSHTADTGITLIDGAIYTVGFENVTDKAGNATASVSNSNITYDSTAVAITNTSPASNGIITTSSVGYTLSEAALSGKVTFTRSGGSADSGSPHVHTLSGSDLYPGSHTVNTNLSLVDGTFYTVTFEATDMAGNPATTVSNAMVFYDSSYGIGPTGNVDNISYSNKRVDGYDLIKLSIAFGSKPGDANWNPVCDFDKSGKVEGNDLIVLGNHFGEVQ